MSYQEKNVIVSLFSGLLLLGYYVLNVVPMYQAGEPDAVSIYSLWLMLIVVATLVNVLGSIITQIVMGIVHMIRTNEEESFVEDERDKLIDLKGTRNMHYVFSVGVLLAMGSMIIGMPPLVMFNLLILSALISNILGDISRLYYYRRGF